MRRPQLNALLIGGLIAALLAGISLSHYMQQDSAPDLSGLILNPPRALPEFSLSRQTGQPYDKASVTGRWQLLFFGFTHCPDVCPTTLAQMRQLRTDLSPAARKVVDFVFVSIDPQRDTPTLMDEYLSHFDPEFIGVTGSEDAIRAFADSIGIAFLKVAEGDSYTMDHATAMVLLDQQSNIKAYFAAPHKLDELKTTLEHLTAP